MPSAEPESQSIENIDKVSIRPGVSILTVLRHLNYKPWFAIAEFVDNALQSAIECKDIFGVMHSGKYRLRVSIEIDEAQQQLRISDNAGGIAAAEFPRAFRPAELPPDTTGLCEFGMGMKSAACWFSPDWVVRTKALEESVCRTVHFDIHKIVRDNIEELSIKTSPAKIEEHFTEIVLRQVFKLPAGRTVGKIREHLGSIYRNFMREGLLELTLDGEALTYDEPRVLVAPFYMNLAEQPKEWRKEISLDFGKGYRASGFAAIRETGSTSEAGFALFRRNRLIEGSADEGYRPEEIFGKPNSFTYQRLFGELHLEGFDVSHTKDGFAWDESEELFLECLKSELNSKPLPLLDQAEGHRAKEKKRDISRVGSQAAASTATILMREAGPVLERLMEAEPDTKEPPKEFQRASSTSARDFQIEFCDRDWRVILETTLDSSISDWITVVDDREKSLSEPREIGVRVTLAHPFIERFGGANQEHIEPLLRLAVAIGLAEITARESGVKSAGTVRRNINDLLHSVLCKP